MSDDKPAKPKRKTPFSPGGSHYRPPRGEGWGGAASHGAHVPFDARPQPTPDAKREGHAVAKTAKELAIPLRQEMIDIIARVARSPKTPPQTVIDAANKLLNRSDGTPSATVDVTSNGQSLGYVIAAPAEVPEAEEWATQHKPR